MNPLLIISAIASPIVGVFKALFGLKEKQAEVVKSGIDGAIEVVKSAEMSDAERLKAAALIINGESSSGGLASQWRPITMLTFLGLIISFWFGYIPPNMTGPMPPIIAEIFALIKIGLCGYIPARTTEKVIDKIVASVNINSILKHLLGK